MNYSNLTYFVLVNVINVFESKVDNFVWRIPVKATEFMMEKIVDVLMEHTKIIAQKYAHKVIIFFFFLINYNIINFLIIIFFKINLEKDLVKYYDFNDKDLNEKTKHYYPEDHKKGKFKIIAYGTKFVEDRFGNPESAISFERKFEWNN